MSLSTVEGGSVGIDVTGMWGITLDVEVPVRLSVTSYSRYAGENYDPAMVSFDGFDTHIENEATSLNEWDPNPIDSVIPVPNVYYASCVDGSGYTVDTYEILVEVFVAAGLEANPDEATTQAGTQVVIPILANDTLNDEPVTLADLAGLPTITQQPDVGIATINESGELVYTAPNGFSGTVTLEYMIETTEPECYWIGSDNSVFEYPDDFAGIPGFVWGETESFTLSGGGDSYGFSYDSEDDRYVFSSDSEYPGCGELGPGIMIIDGSEEEVCIESWFNGCS